MITTIDRDALMIQEYGNRLHCNYKKNAENVRWIMNRCNLERKKHLKMNIYRKCQKKHDFKR